MKDEEGPAKKKAKTTGKGTMVVAVEVKEVYSLECSRWLFAVADCNDWLEFAPSERLTRGRSESFIDTGALCCCGIVRQKTH